MLPFCLLNPLSKMFTGKQKIIKLALCLTYHKGSINCRFLDTTLTVGVLLEILTFFLFICKFFSRKTITFICLLLFKMHSRSKIDCWLYKEKISFWVMFIAAAAKSLQSCPTLCNPIDGGLPGSPVPRILQARTLEWVAISFSNAWKCKVKAKSLSCVWLLATPPGSSAHGILQARVLEWVANYYQLKNKWEQSAAMIGSA